MKHKYAVLLIIMIVLQSCSGRLLIDLVHLRTLKKKSHKTMASANLFLSKNKIDTLFSYQIDKELKDSMHLANYNLNLYKLEHGGKAAVLQLRMYNNKGNLVGGWENCYGDLKYFNLLDSFPLKKIEHIPVNKKIKLSRDLDLLIFSENERRMLEDEIKKYNFILIMYWAEWTGWWNRDLIKRTRAYTEEYKSKSLLFIKVNTDI